MRDLRSTKNTIKKLWIAILVTGLIIETCLIAYLAGVWMYSRDWIDHQDYLVSEQSVSAQLSDRNGTPEQLTQTLDVIFATDFLVETLASTQIPVGGTQSTTHTLQACWAP